MTKTPPQLVHVRTALFETDLPKLAIMRTKKGSEIRHFSEPRVITPNLSARISLSVFDNFREYEQ